MLLENVCHGRRELAVLNMVRQGLFGDTMACGNPRRAGLPGWSGRTLGWFGQHLAAKTQLEQAMASARSASTSTSIAAIAYLTSTASKSGIRPLHGGQVRPRPPRRQAEFACGDVVTTVLKCHHGETVVCNYDQSPRPYSHMLRVQGTKGLFMEDGNSIHAEGRRPGKYGEPDDKYQEEFEHPLWKRFGEEGQEYRAQRDGLLHRPRLCRVGQAPVLIRPSTPGTLPPGVRSSRCPNSRTPGEAPPWSSPISRKANGRPTRVSSD